MPRPSFPKRTPIAQSTKKEQTRGLPFFVPQLFSIHASALDFAYDVIASAL